MLSVTSDAFVSVAALLEHEANVGHEEAPIIPTVSCDPPNIGFIRTRGFIVKCQAISLQESNHWLIIEKVPGDDVDAVIATKHSATHELLSKIT